MRTQHLLALSLMMLCTSAHAITDIIDEWSFQPFFGVDGGVRHQSYDANYGEALLSHDYPQANFYFGSVFYKYLGFEAGYEYSFAQSKNQYYFPDQSTLGYLPGSSTSRLHMSESYIDGWHLDLQGYWPICPKTKTTITGTLGLAWLKAHYETYMLADDAGAPPNTVTSPAFWSSDTRALLRAGLGLEQLITKHFGARVQVLWENTSKLGGAVDVPITQRLGGDEGAYLISPNNSYIATIGFYFQIDKPD